MACLWLYFTFAEYLTTWYAHEPNEIAVFDAKFSGHFAPYFWAMFVFCFVIPFVILANNKTRTVAGTVVASISVNIGMWLERFTIVVPSLSNPRAPIHGFGYAPSWVEWSLMAGCFAAFALLYMGFTKLFPIISIWELEEAAPQDAGRPPRCRDGRGGCLMRARLLGSVALLGLSVVSAAEEPSVRLSVELPNNPTAGARLFVTKACVRCHSLGGEEARVGPDLGRIHLTGTVLDIAGAFWNHSPVMREKMQDLKIPAPTMTSREMADLVAFLTAYRYYLTEVGEPANPAAGHAVFVSKGCVQLSRRRRLLGQARAEPGPLPGALLAHLPGPGDVEPWARDGQADAGTEHPLAQVRGSGDGRPARLPAGRQRGVAPSPCISSPAARGAVVTCSPRSAATPATRLAGRAAGAAPSSGRDAGS